MAGFRVVAWKGQLEEKGLYHDGWKVERDFGDGRVRVVQSFDEKHKAFLVYRDLQEKKIPVFKSWL